MGEALRLPLAANPLASGLVPFVQINAKQCGSWKLSGGKPKEAGGKGWQAVMGAPPSPAVHPPFQSCIPPACP